jgi:hypothetical protein
MATNKYQEAWFAAAPGRATNPDNVGGFQCVDAFHDYGMAIFGKTWQETSGWGNAKDLFWGPSTEYWVKIQNDPNDPNLIPQRGDVIVWGGTPEWGVNPFGHIAVCLSATAASVTVVQQDGFLQCPMFVGTLPYDGPGTGMVIGWLRPNFDEAPVPAPAPNVVPANHRFAGDAAVNLRAEPASGSAVLDKIDAREEWVFSGWVHGEELTIGNVKTDVWFKDELGYAWAGLFTDGSGSGLTDLNPPAAPAILPYQRDTGKDGAISRKGPDKNAEVVEVFVPDRRLDFKGYVHGTMPFPNTTDVWLVGKYSGSFVWSGGLTDGGTHDLPDLTVKAPAPAPVAAYDFKLDFIQIGTIRVEKIPAHITNVDVGNFPANPKWSVHHWWGQPPIPFTSPLGEWARAQSFKSPHFQVGDTRIAQIVSLKDRAYHAGPEGNSSVGIEIDPRIMERGADGKPTAVAEAIAANVRYLYLALKSRYGYELTPILHKNVPGNSTTCSPIELGWLYPVVTAPPVTPAPVEPAPVPAPVVPAPAPEDGRHEAARDSALLSFFADLAKKIIEWLYPKGK